MNACIIYITAGSREEAVAVGRRLVEARLVACANVLPAITSLFWWEGAVEEDEEVALIVKTRRDLVDSVVAEVKAVHSYDCPCVIALPIEGGNGDFLNWIAKETK